MKLKTLSLFLAFFAIGFLMTSCDEDDPITIDSSEPSGNFTVQRAGTLTAQSGTPTAGTVEVGVDEDNANFLRFGDDFMTELATGTVSIYFSTSDTFTADPGNGNPDLRLVGPVQGNGEQFIKLEQSVSSNFTHLILWCNTASIPFGYAPLQ